MIRSLSTVSFRNLVDAEIPLATGQTLFLGDNGAGKTSILEAIYVAATSKSFRAGQIEQCRREGDRGFSVAVESEIEGRHRVVVAWDSETSLSRRVNGSTVSLSQHLGIQPVLALTDRDAALLDGAPQLRRRLLDSLMIQERPTALATLARLRAVLQAKKAAIAQGQDLTPWNQLLAPLMVEIQRWREACVGDLAERFTQRVEELGLGELRPRLSYAPSRPDRGVPDRGVSDRGGSDQRVFEEEELVRALAARSGDERACGYLLWGPQRDDWRTSVFDRGVAARASQGERKALTLALLVAATERLVDQGGSPILLVDDVESYLDSRRLAEALVLLRRLPQVLLASSHRQRWEGAPMSSVYTVESGKVGA